MATTINFQIVKRCLIRVVHPDSRRKVEPSVIGDLVDL